MVKKAKHSFGLIFPCNVLVVFLQQNMVKELPEVLTVNVWEIWKKKIIKHINNSCREFQGKNHLTHTEISAQLHTGY